MDSRAGLTRLTRFTTLAGLNNQSQPVSGPPHTSKTAQLPGLARLARWAAKAVVVMVCTVVLALAVAGSLSRDRIEIPPNRPGQYVDLLGDRIRVHQTGSGPDLLMIHGMTGLIEDWEPVFGPATNRYRITAYDRPGHGYSSAPEQYTLAHNADTALALIDKLKLKDVIVVGHSYGGAVAVAMAVRNPPQVKAFVLLGGLTTYHDHGPTVLDLQRLPVVGRGIAVVGCRFIGEGMLKGSLSQVYHPNEALLTEDVITLRAPVYLQPKVAMSISREVAALKSDLAIIQGRLPMITQPLHLVHGEQDRILSVEDSLRFHEHFPATRLTVLKDTGHAVMSAHPETVLAVIDSLAK
jgi:pimeloyl-ACP methyl ester carboxylesterase